MMGITSASPELALRSHDTTWDRTRWERLPADGNRYEVIDGVLYVSTAPSVFHQWIVGRLFMSLNRQIDDLGVGITFASPVGLFMPGCDPVQPDVLVIRPSDHVRYEKGRVVGVPSLLVEVVSPSHPDSDLRVKREAYAKAGVPEYWIARPRTRDVLVCTQPDATLGDYVRTELFGEADELASPTLPVHLAVGSLFAGAPDTTL